MEGIKSARLYEESSAFTPGGVSSPVRAFDPYPLFMKSGHGCHITDVDDNDYIDMCMAYGPLIVGHACKRVVDAASDQLQKGSVYGAPSEPELALIKTLCNNVPSMDMVRLSVSGTESTMHAIRLARGFTGRDGIVKMNGGFHGAHDAVLVKAGSGSTNGVPGSKGVPADAVKNTYTVEYNDPDMMDELLDKNEGIACVIMEPVMGNVGVVLPEKNYLQTVRKITEDHNVILIFDEVITGCRLSKGGAQKVYGVTPDMTTMAKIIGGGLPAGAFGGRKDIMENVAPQGQVYVAGTFAGNPVSAAAGLETINIMSEGDHYDVLNKRTKDLVNRMRDSMKDNRVKGCVQSVGSMFSVFFGPEYVKNGTQAQTADRDMFDRMFRYMLKNNIYFAPSALEVSFMSLVHGEDVVDKIAHTFDDFTKEVGQ
ncbi:MAG: glutamate-1-semialdehyde 2,1-aminomutase [Candidatus Methanomethylophilaceae archaeon]|nr:glutamate-1-semialdehyde 2,1-aminomutase [Candidatus Methanomethylophilaceae archaeon]